MKINDKKSLKQKTYEDLKKLLDEKRLTLSKHEVEKQVKQEKNVRLKKIRKNEIAVIKTFMQYKKQDKEQS